MMAVRKDKYTTVTLRLPNEVIALLRARHCCDKSMYELLRDVVKASAESSLIDCAFSAEEYTRLDLLAKRIGFSDVAQMARHLLLAYLQMCCRHDGAFANEVEANEIKEMFEDMNVLNYEEARVTTHPRKIRGL